MAKKLTKGHFAQILKNGSDINEHVQLQFPTRASKCLVVLSLFISLLTSDSDSLPDSHSGSS